MGSFSGQGWAWLLGGLVLQSHPRLNRLCCKESGGREGCWNPPPTHKGMITHKPLQLGPGMLASSSRVPAHLGICLLSRVMGREGAREGASGAEEFNFLFPLISTPHNSAKPPGLAAGGHLGCSNAAFRDPVPPEPEQVPNGVQS